jgi:hypothetical protein
LFEVFIELKNQLEICGIVGVLLGGVRKIHLQGFVQVVLHDLRNPILD